MNILYLLILAIVIIAAIVSWYFIMYDYSEAPILIFTISSGIMLFIGVVAPLGKSTKYPVIEQTTTQLITKQYSEFVYIKDGQTKTLVLETVPCVSDQKYNTFIVIDKNAFGFELDPYLKNELLINVEDNKL